MKFIAAAIYCTVLDALILGGCAYVVFWRGASGWWFVLAILLSASVGVPEGVRRPLPQEGKP